MKAKLVLFVLTLVALRAESILEAKSESRTMQEALELFALTPGPKQHAIDRLPPARRAELAAALKEHASQSEYPNQFNFTLIHLGDEEFVQQQAELILHGDYRQSVDALQLLATWHDPMAVGASCPVFLLGDDAAAADVATEIVLVMISKTPGFSAEVYKWVHDVGQGLPYFGRLILCEWWKENAVHFQKRDYLAVKPGGLPPKGGFPGLSVGRRNLSCSHAAGCRRLDTRRASSSPVNNGIFSHARTHSDSGAFGESSPIHCGESEQFGLHLGRRPAARPDSRHFILRCSAQVMHRAGQVLRGSSLNIHQNSEVRSPVRAPRIDHP